MGLIMLIKLLIGNALKAMLLKFKRGSIRDEFAEHITLHGVPSIMRAKTRFQRNFWTGVFIFSLIAMTWQIIDSLTTYLSYPKTTTQSTVPAGATFPWVTVCPNEPYPLFGDDHYDEEFKKKTGEYKTKVIEQALALLGSLGSHKIKKQEFNSLVYPFIMSMEGLSYSEVFSKTLLHSAGYQKFHYIAVCVYKGKPCDLVDQMYTSFSRKTGNCFTFAPQDERVIAGIARGLTLILFTGLAAPHPFGDKRTSFEQTSKVGEHFSFRDDLDGGRIVIHEPHTKPFANTNGLDFGAASSTNYRLSAFRIHRAETPIRSCVNETHWEGNVEYLYGDPECQQICHQRALEKLCKCVEGDSLVLHAPDTKTECLTNYQVMLTATVEKCKSNKLACTKSFNEFMDYMRCPLTIRSSQIYHECVLMCTNPCASKTWGASISTSTWPVSYPGQQDAKAEISAVSAIFDGTFYSQFSEKQVKILKDKVTKGITGKEDWSTVPIKKQKEALKHFTVVNVFFASTDLVLTVESRAIVLVKLFSDVGSISGLWIGVSLMTIVELLVFLYKYLKQRHSKKD